MGVGRVGGREERNLMHKRGGGEKGKGRREEGGSVSRRYVGA